MKKYIAVILALLMVLTVAAALGGCKDKKDSEAGIATKATVEEEKEKAKETDGGDDTAEDLPDAEVVKTFAPDSEDEIGHDLPLEIESITLFKDGSVRIVPTGDLKKNELGDSEATSIMPFAESGELKDLYIYRIGNGGYRVILGITKEGTVSAVNALALLEDHIAVVMDNLGGRDSFVSIVQEESEDGYSIVGKTEEGDDVVLDPVLLSEDARGTAAEED